MISLESVILDLERKLEKRSDWLLPYAIKDIRQTIRSKVFLGTFFLGFFAAAFVAFWGGVLVIPEHYSHIGPKTFLVFNAIVDIGVLLVLPVLTATAMNQERNDNSFELQQITSSTPLKIVAGKWQSGMVQVLFFFFMIMPFLSFSYILRGITISQIFFYCFLSLLLSQFLICLSVFASSVSGIKKTRQSLNFLLTLVAGSFCLSVLSWKNSMVYSWGEVEVQMLTASFWSWLIVWVVLLFLFEGFIFAVSAGLLSAYSANKSFGPKIFFILIMIAMTLISVFVDTNAFFAITFWIYLVFFIIASIFVLENDRLAKRYITKLNQTPKMLVFVRNLFYPGRSSALFGLLLMLTSISLTLYFVGQYKSVDQQFLLMLGNVHKCLAVYLAVFYSVGFYFEKELGKENPKLVYGLSILIILLFFIVFPFFISWDYSIVHSFNLFIMALPLRSDGAGFGSDRWFSVVLGGVITFVLLVFSAVNMKREVRVHRNYTAGERGNN